MQPRMFLGERERHQASLHAHELALVPATVSGAATERQRARGCAVGVSCRCGARLSEAAHRTCRDRSGVDARPATHLDLAAQRKPHPIASATHMSKSASGLISRPVVRVMYCARRALLASLQSRKAFWKALSSAYWTRRSIFGRSVSQSSEPSVLVMSAARAGLHCRSQRRGVMPATGQAEP